MLTEIVFICILAVMCIRIGYQIGVSAGAASMKELLDRKSEIEKQLHE